MCKSVLILISGIILLPLFGQTKEGEKALLITPQIKTYDYDAMPKDPMASVFFSATFPGTGQIYNKEIARGLWTAFGFYGGLLLVQYELQRWDQLNTDTFYIEGFDENNRRTGFFHRVTSPKPDGEQLGLPTSEKVALGSAFAIMVGSYVWGIIDSYRGAKRYNKKLVSQAARPLKLDLGYSTRQKRTQLTAFYSF